MGLKLFFILWGFSGCGCCVAPFTTFKLFIFGFIN